MNDSLSTPAPVALGFRSALRVAVEGRAAAHATLAAARRAADRAADLVTKLESRFAELRAVDAEATAFRAEQVKMAADDEDVRVAALPAALADRVRAKVEAEAEMHTARALHEALLKDVTAAEQNVSTLTRSTHEAVLAVLLDEVEPMAEELADLEARAIALRELLVSYDHTKTMLPGMSGIADARTTLRIGNILRFPPQPSRIGPNPEQMRAWRDYYLTLAGDPDATNRPGPASAATAAE